MLTDMLVGGVMCGLDARLVGNVVLRGRFAGTVM